MDLNCMKLPESILVNLPYFVLAVDKQHNIICLNKVARQFINYSDSCGKGSATFYYNKFDVVPLNKNEDEADLIKAISDSKKIDSLILKINRKKSEKVRYFEISVFPIEESLEVEGSVIIGRDITVDYLNKKNLDEERNNLIIVSTELKAKCEIVEILRKREKEYLVYLKNIITNISEGIIVLDEYGQFNLSNKASYTVTGLDARDLINFFALENQFSVIGEKNKEIPLQELYSNYVKKHVKIKNTILKCKVTSENKEKYIEMNTTPVFENGKFINTIVTLKDITQIKLNEIAREEQNRFIREIVDTVDVPIAVVGNPKPSVALLNKTVRDLVRNISNYEIDNGEQEEHRNEGKEIEKNIINSNNFLPIRETFQKACASQEEVIIPKFKVTELGGKERIFRVKIKPFKSKYKKDMKVVVHGVEVTDETNHNLRLQEINRIKDEFFTVTSHELRTPLTIIKSSIQLAYDVYGEEIGKNLDKTLKRINQNCSRLLKLVNNILDLSKAEAGFLEVNSTKFDIVYETEAIVELVNTYAESKSINLIFDTNVEEAEVVMDRDKYGKIVLNLLSNAIKYTPEGKGVFVCIQVTKKHVSLVVEDEGIGIPKDKQDYIFERFTQVSSPLSRSAEGTGIGLSLVKKIVEIMCGKISVVSEPEKGAIFMVKLKRFFNEDNSNEYNEPVESNINEKVNIEFSDIN